MVSLSSFYLLDGVLRVDCHAAAVPTQGIRLCVTGGRDIDDCDYVWDALDEIAAETPIAELGAGCARGVDSLALAWAGHHGIAWRRYTADWERLGTAAGSGRNVVMLKDFAPDKLAVFDGGVGTTHCSRAARKLNIERIPLQRGLHDPFADLMKWG